MQTARLTIMPALAAVFFSACGGPASNTTKPAAAAPTADALFALDKQANEAWIRGDAKFFEGFVSDKFIAWERGQRMDKAAVVQMIASGKCEMKDWKIEDPQMSTIDPDTAVLSYRGTFDGTCTGPDGKSMTVPSPVRAATVWVRSGDSWKVAFHGKNLIYDPKNSPPPPASKSAEDPNTDATKPAADPSTDAMLAAEQRVWEAWRVRDAKKIEDLTTKDLSFVNIFGAYFANKSDTVNDWTAGNCEVTSVSVTDGVGTSLSPTLGILTVKGTGEGTCEGQKLPPVYGTTVYVKEGDAWKMAFGFNRLLD